MTSMLDRLRRQPPQRFVSDSARDGDIVIRDVTKSFGVTTAIKDLSLSVQFGELLVLLGPSGSGKTTTLNLIAGLEELDRGSIYFGKTNMTHVPPEDRDISIVFQNYSLYPHLNVRENITFPLVIRRTPARVVAERLENVTALLGIQTLLDRKINQLSGGQRQRVAIAKALTKRPTVFLLDEPFSALDAVVRRQLRAELVRLHRELGTTMVFVTHDQEEAMTIADRIAVMRDGAIVQIGSPLDIYNDPTDLWVAQFIGSHPVNVVRSFHNGSSVHLFRPDGPSLAVSRDIAKRLETIDRSAGVILGIRPEFVEVARSSPDRSAGVRGCIFTRQVFGNEILYDITVEEGVVRAVIPTLPSTKVYSPGDSVSLDIMWSGVLAFDSASERRLPLSFASGGG